MHPEAYEFVEQCRAKLGDISMCRVVELGSRDVNGSPRSLFTGAASYLGIDSSPGPGVDVVEDAADWQPDGEYDIIICMETFEHTPRWVDILDVIVRALRYEGWCILTMATDPREPHSCTPGNDPPLAANEWYQNVSLSMLKLALQMRNFHIEEIRTHPRGDLYAFAQIR